MKKIHACHWGLYIILICFSVGCSSSSTEVLHGTVLRLDYEGFTVWLDCDRHGATKFRYNVQHDTGSFPRYDQFYLDPSVPKECQQKTAASYSTKGIQGAPRYDRGHQVPANHLDFSEVAIRQTNSMTNILPQTATLNRGAWLESEKLIECYRDIDELLVIGGVIWGNNPKDDYFIKSHGVATPDAFWKVVIRGNGDAIAWIMPNTNEATAKNVDRYLVSIAELEQVVGETIPVEPYIKTKKLKHGWIMPIGCDQS